MVQVLEIVAAGSLSIMVIYWIVVFIKILSYKPAKRNSIHAVSVIVCAHNELANLKKLIPILLEQNHSEFEVIIVDDRSDDGTYDYLLENKSDRLKLVRVDQVHDHINAKKYALTLGIKAAAHDIILLTDADCTPASRDWIQHMTGSFDAKTSFALGVSPYTQGRGLLGHFIKFETQWTAMHYIGFALAGNPYMGVGRNLAYRKSNFLKHNGFSKIQHITGGDDDLLVNHRATKSSTKVVLGKEALTYSLPKGTWKSFIDQKIRHWSVGRYYRATDKILLGFQNFANLVFWMSLTILAMQTNNFYIPTGLLIFRMVFITIVISGTSKKFGDRMNLWLVPVMDILYVGFASLFGITALLTKKVKWKK